jgi:Holliday junction resolvase RusA-like endonuclease
VKATLPVPPLLNALYRVSRGKMYKDNRAAGFKTEVYVTLKKLGVKCIDDGEVEMEINWYRKKKAGDIDATLKCLLDALEGLVYKNDSQIKKLTIIRHDDKLNPRVELEWFLFDS